MTLSYSKIESNCRMSKEKWQTTGTKYLTHTHTQFEVVVCPYHFRIQN